MRVVTFGSDHRHPLTTAALQVVEALDGIEHVDHVTREDQREFMRDPASPAFRSHLVNLKPDLFLSAAYARILPEEALPIPTLGAINVHPALLPAYRGVRAISVVRPDEQFNRAQLPAHADRMARFDSHRQDGGRLLRSRVLGRQRRPCVRPCQPNRPGAGRHHHLRRGDLRLRSRATSTPQAPQNTAPPTIAGAAQQGSTLTANPGTWTGSPTPTFAYQWQRCNSQGASCADISSATGQTYLVNPADLGSTLLVKVTATNASGSATLGSAITSVVVAAQGPTTPLLDDFNRANGALGSNWGQVFGGFLDFTISNNEAIDASSSSYAWDYWKAQQFGPASEAYATVKTTSATDTIRVCARMVNPSSSGRSGYCVHVAAGAWTIKRLDNGTATTLGATVNQAISVGDRISITAIGSAISGWYFSAASGTWTQLLSRTDTTYAGPGYLALESRASHLDNFGGGTIR